MNNDYQGLIQGWVYLGEWRKWGENYLDTVPWSLSGFLQKGTLFGAAEDVQRPFLR